MAKKQSYSTPVDVSKIPPMISRDRQMFAMLRVIKDYSPAEIEKASGGAANGGVSASCIRNWRKTPGKDAKAVMYPSSRTMIRVAQAVGLSLELVNPKTKEVIKK